MQTTDDIRTSWTAGLPSVEDVLAHEARGGRWHRRHRDGTHPAEIVSLYLCDGVIWERDGGGARPAIADGLYEYRPCSPDGDSLSWMGRPSAGEEL